MTTENLTVPVNEQVQPTVNNDAQAQEKMLKQSDVNDLVGHAKQKGYEKGYQQALAELQKQQPAQPAFNQAQQPVSNQPNADIDAKIQQAINEDWAKRQQAIQEQQKLAAAHEMIARVLPKIEEAKNRYEDIDQVIGKAEFSKTAPKAVWLADSVDNTGDVLYDLAKNPLKMAGLQTLAERNPALALEEVRKLSDSIKQNQQAAKQPTPQEPLSQLKPVNIGVDNGVKDAAYYRKLYRSGAR